MQLVLCQRGKAENGIERRAHVMGHIRKKRIFCSDGKVCVVQSFFQKLLLLDFTLYFIVYPAEAKDDLRNVLAASYIYDPKLQILCFERFYYAVIDIIGLLGFQLAADICDRRLAGDGFFVFWVHPDVGIV